ncbi:MAG: DNA-processing protein DprA [Streptosporangiaceae bacterium]|jgi:DNA processing protein
MNDERYARAALTYLAEPEDVALARLVADVGAARAVEMIKTGGDSRWQARINDLPGPAEMKAFASAGIRLVCPGDPEWPSRLEDLGDKTPYALWLRGNGDLRLSCLRSVAIVGARAATAYGSYMATELASALAASGWAIVSGGAYGVDAAAHRGALASGGVTIAVMACGVDHPYPAGHVELMNAITKTGVVMSEWPPGCNATRLRFLSRNRVIAALAAGTVVVEAGRRSGALNTAKHAGDLERPLMAVPGPVTSQLSAGCHMMIRNWGAALVTTTAEVTETLGLDTADWPQQPVLPWDELDPGLKKVLDALPARGGISTAEVAVAAGVDPRTAVTSLGALAAGGFAERCPGGWRVRRSHTTGDGVN